MSKVMERTTPEHRPRRRGPGARKMNARRIVGVAGRPLKLARKGETMTTAAMVAYAYDQIDQARVALNTVSK